MLSLSLILVLNHLGEELPNVWPGISKEVSKATLIWVNDVKFSFLIHPLFTRSWLSFANVTYLEVPLEVNHNLLPITSLQRLLWQRPVKTWSGMLQWVGAHRIHLSFFSDLRSVLHFPVFRTSIGKAWVGFCNSSLGKQKACFFHCLSTLCPICLDKVHSETLLYAPEHVGSWAQLEYLTSSQRSRSAQGRCPGWHHKTRLMAESVHGTIFAYFWLLAW